MQLQIVSIETLKPVVLFLVIFLVTLPASKDTGKQAGAGHNNNVSSVMNLTSEDCCEA
jgi:hypothetical protein